MAVTSIRVTAMTALVAALNASTDLVGVVTTLEWPGDQITPEAIWLESPDGTMTVPYFHGIPSASNRVTRRDDFTMALQIRAGLAGQTAEEAAARATAILAGVEKVAAADPTFGNVDGLLWALLGEVNGPATGRLDTGCVSFIHAVFDCKAQEG